MTDIQSATAENRRGKKKKERKKEQRRNHRGRILWPALLGGHNKYLVLYAFEATII